jgi:hypothetical protein
MKVSRVILAGTAIVQFITLLLVSNPEARTFGIVIGVLSGMILLLLSLGVYPAERNQSRENSCDSRETAE